MMSSCGGLFYAMALLEPFFNYNLSIFVKNLHDGYVTVCLELDICVYERKKYFVDDVAQEFT